MADNKADAQWTPIEEAKLAASASEAPPTLGTVLQATQQEATTPAQHGKDQAPNDPPDSGRVKRAAVEKAGAKGPQPKSKS